MNQARQSQQSDGKAEQETPALQDLCKPCQFHWNSPRRLKFVPRISGLARIALDKAFALLESLLRHYLEYGAAVVFAAFGSRSVQIA